MSSTAIYHTLGRTDYDKVLADLAQLREYARGFHERDAIEIAARVLPYGGKLDEHVISLLTRIIQRKNAQDRYGQ